MIKSWIEKRVKEKKEEYYQNGYSWAAVELLKSGGDDATIMYIEDVTYHDAISNNFDFDRGALKALEDWRSLDERNQISKQIEMSFYVQEKRGEEFKAFKESCQSDF